jgi:competence protein ComEC
MASFSETPAKRETMKRPLVAVVSFYVAGLLIAEIFRPPLITLFAVTFFVLVLALILKQFRPSLIWLLLVLVGWTNLTVRTAVISPDDVRTLIGNAGAIASIRGVLEETPKLKISEYGGDPTEHSLAQVRVSELRRSENWQPAFGEIVVTTPGILPEQFFAGQVVEIAGVVALPPPPLAEGLFDYRDYLQTRGIYYELKAGSTNDWQLCGSAWQKPPLTDRFLNWSKRTLAVGLPAEDEPLRLLWAMTLGWRTAFTGDISEPFLRAGTMHLFAIDGLRIALISGMLVALLRVLQVSRAWCGLVAIPAIWFYTAATGWESSAIRASIMMTVVIGGWALKRPASLINTLAAAAFIILLWEPRQFFEAGFQLSFCVMLVIGLLLPRMNKLTDAVLRHDPLVPDNLIPKWRRTFVSISRMFMRYLSLSIAAWLGSIPLSALYFHLFSPISAPANLIAVPLGTLALMSNLGALVCGAWFPWATEMFNHSAWFFMAAMTKASLLATEIPGAYFYVPGPSWVSIVLYYFILIIVLSGWLKTAGRKSFAAVLVIFIVAIYSWQWGKSWGETELTVLPLDGGHAVYVDAAGRKGDRLVNCGDENAVEFALTPFLHSQGVNQIPRLVLTEGSVRNIGGVQSLGKLFDIGELFTSPVHFRSTVYRDAVTEFNRPPARRKVIQCGDITGNWQVLYPGPADDFPHADDNALVLLGNFHGASVLLLSDLGRDGQSALLERTNDLHADIVIAGLPGEGEPLCTALVDAIHPQVIVVADSEFPANRRASRSLKARLEQTKIPVIYTGTSGAAKIVADKSGWKLKTMDERKFASP